MNPTSHFMSHPKYILFQSILPNQGEFSVFPLSSFTISLSKFNSLSLSLADSNILFRRFILSELLGGGLLSMTVKYLKSVPLKNVCIICDLHCVPDILDNSLSPIPSDSVHP